MRIGFDAKRAFFNQTGLGNYSRFIIQGCIARYPNEEYTLFSPQTTKKGKSMSWPSSTQVDVVDLGNGFQGSLNRVFGMGRYMRRHSLDIYHGLSNELPVGLSTVSTKLVVSVHDLLFMRYPSFYPWVDRSIYKAKTKLSCKRADLVLAISEQTKRDLVELLHIPENKIRVHYQTCHPQFLQPVSEEQIHTTKLKYGISKSYVLQVGTLENRKNALTTLKAFSQSSLSQDIDLVFLGNKTTYCEQLYSFVKEKKLGKTVHFIHRANFADFPALYSGALFTVYPSLFEGFGIPVLESLMMGIPVITSKGGCFQEVGGAAAVYVGSTNTEELAIKMEELANNTSLRASLVEKGKKQVEKFKEAPLIQELHGIYTSLL